jgi:hypothetical protein
MKSAMYVHNQSMVRTTTATTVLFTIAAAVTLWLIGSAATPAATELGGLLVVSAVWCTGVHLMLSHTILYFERVNAPMAFTPETDSHKNKRAHKHHIVAAPVAAAATTPVSAIPAGGAGTELGTAPAAAAATVTVDVGPAPAVNPPTAAADAVDPAVAAALAGMPPKLPLDVRTRMSM